MPMRWWYCWVYPVICHLWSFCTLILIFLHSVWGFFSFLFFFLSFLFHIHLVAPSSPYTLWYVSTCTLTYIIEYWRRPRLGDFFFFLSFHWVHSTASWNDYLNIQQLVFLLRTLAWFRDKVYKVRPRSPDSVTCSPSPVRVIVIGSFLQWHLAIFYRNNFLERWTAHPLSK